MADKRYQVTTYGTGFHGPGQRWLGATRLRVRRKLRRFEGPYHYQGQPKRQMRRKDIIDRLMRDVRDGHIGDKWVIKGANYDQPGVAVRIIKDVPDESPRVTYGRRFIGGTRYVFGTIPSLPLPTTADCSGFVLRCVKEVDHIDLPHSSDAIMNHPRVRTFSNPDDLRSGDFVFYNFGRLPAGTADDITMVVRPGSQIGSRPSRNGVAIFDMGPERPWVLRYGRLG